MKVGIWSTQINDPASTLISQEIQLTFDIVSIHAGATTSTKVQFDKISSSSKNSTKYFCVTEVSHSIKSFGFQWSKLGYSSVVLFYHANYDIMIQKLCNQTNIKEKIHSTSRLQNTEMITELKHLTS